MRYAALFLWLAAPVAIWLGVTFYGTPHLVVTYRFMDNGAAYDLSVPRRYIDCTYIGWTGARTEPAIQEHCPWLRFFVSETR